MISSSDPSACRLTPLGTFASLLPMSTHLSRLVSFGIRLGLGGFAVILSVILGRKLTRPFRMPIAMYSNPDDYNDQMREVFSSYLKLDRNTHSEPIMLLRLYLNWDSAGRQGKKNMEAFVDSKKMTLIEVILCITMYIKALYKHTVNTCNSNICLYDLLYVSTLTERSKCSKAKGERRTGAAQQPRDRLRK